MRFFYSPVPNTYTVQLIKPSGEVWRIEFTDATRAEALRTLGRWASNPELTGFGWYDAAMLSQRIRTMTTEKGCVGK